MSTGAGECQGLSSYHSAWSTDYSSLGRTRASHGPPEATALEDTQPSDVTLPSLVQIAHCDSHTEVLGGGTVGGRRPNGGGRYSERPAGSGQCRDAGRLNRQPTDLIVGRRGSLSIESGSRTQRRRGRLESRIGNVSPANGRPPPGLTLTAMPADRLADAIEFLQERSTDALRRLRNSNSSDKGGGLGTAQAEGPVPGQRDPAVIHLDAVKESAGELLVLRAYLQNYADRIEPIPSSEPRLLAATDALRRLMEAVYEDRIRFTGEARIDEDEGADVKWADRARQARADARTALGDDQDAETWNVRNLTAKQIELTGPGQPTRALPAFGSVTLETEPTITFDNVGTLTACNRLEVTQNITSRQTALLVVLGLAFWVVPLFVVAALIWGDRTWWLIGIAVLATAVVLALMGRERWDVVGEALRGAPRRALNLFSLLLVVLFALVLPGVTIYLGADLYDVFERARAGPLTDGGTDDLTLLGRGMQLLFIAAASMLPGLLYFQFDRERLGTIWEKFTRHIFRLDPSVTTEPALIAKYGFLMEEVFGRRQPTRRGRLLPGKLSPIVVATLVIVLGWLLTLLNPDVGAVADQGDLVSLFQPHQSAVTFAFLGAYVYALGALLRGYVRRDLRPKSYTDITVRIITVAALASLLQVLFPDDAAALLVFAFATGLVPQTAFTLLREAIQSSDPAWSGARPGKRGKRASNRAAQDEAAGDGAPATRDGSPDKRPLSELEDPLPLTDLEGIDLYDRARLASEGITNIEALAHSDLVELLVQTRIPAPRLVDWVDQSIFYLHVPRNDIISTWHEDPSTQLSSYEVLRRVGIRNATDLLRAADKAKKADDDKSAEEDKCADRDKCESTFLQILGRAGEGGPARLSVIVDAIEDEEWISNLRYWRSHGDPDSGDGESPSEA
jgi:hypothetical protein